MGSKWVRFNGHLLNIKDKMASLSSIFPFGIGYNEGGTGLSGSMALRPPRRPAGARRQEWKAASCLRVGQLRYLETGPERSRYSAIMDEDSEVARIALPSRAVFDSVRAKLLFESISLGPEPPSAKEVLHLWLENYQTSRDFRKRGIVELELP
jgi:hypothetical protein